MLSRQIEGTSVIIHDFFSACVSACVSVRASVSLSLCPSVIICLSTDKASVMHAFLHNTRVSQDLG